MQTEMVFLKEEINRKWRVIRNSCLMIDTDRKSQKIAIEHNKKPNSKCILRNMRIFPHYTSDIIRINIMNYKVVVAKDRDQLHKLVLTGITLA